MGKQTITWAQAFRDVLIEAIRKGQILAIGLAVVIIVFISRIPQADLIQIWNDFSEVENKVWIINVILNVALALLWFVHARYLRKNFADEIERVCQERNRTQQKLGIGVKSSNNKEEVKL
jgi:hypothetical protein